MFEAARLRPRCCPFPCEATKPTACALALLHSPTVEHARSRGLGDALTRLAARTGFEMGGAAAWLGASEMGAGPYRRIGFQGLGTTLVELRSPAGEGT